MSAHATTCNAQQALETAIRQALLASRDETFAVGGCLIENATGKVLIALHNQVLRSPGSGEAQPAFRLHDPTAFAERRLIDWYFENRQRLALPPPGELTVVTTLDPCAMCAGALLMADFNVAAGAHDAFAGINHNGLFDFPGLPQAPRQQAQASWGYYAVAAPFERDYAGSSAGPIYAGEQIDATTLGLASSLFEASVNRLHDETHRTSQPRAALQDPATLPQYNVVRQALASMSPWSLRVRSANPRIPGAELAPPLLEAARAASTANAVALLDPFGNLLACLGGAQQHSPIRTAFMETTRNYAALRWDLMNHADPQVRRDAQAYLPHPRHCTFILLAFPDPAGSEAVMTLGAYGSTVERPTAPSFPSGLQYVTLPGGHTHKEIAELAQRLPPLYTQIMQVAPCQVLDEGLIRAITEGLEQIQREAPTAG